MIIIITTIIIDKLIDCIKYNKNIHNLNKYNINNNNLNKYNINNNNIINLIQTIKIIKISKTPINHTQTNNKHNKIII